MASMPVPVPSRLVGAGAKGHARVEFNNVVARLRFVVAPAGLDDHVLAQTDGSEVLFPALRPVFFIHGMGQHFQLAEVKGQFLRAQAGKALAMAAMAFSRCSSTG